MRRFLQLKTLIVCTLVWIISVVYSPGEGVNVMANQTLLQYCAWDTRGDKCAGAQSWPKGSQAAFLQSVPTGRHAECPAPATPPATSARLGTVINQLSPGAAVTRDEAADTRHSSGPSSRGGAGGGLVEAENPSVEASVVLFSLETLIITVSAGAVAALVVGFVTGEFICSPFEDFAVV